MHREDWFAVLCCWSIGKVRITMANSSSYEPLSLIEQRRTCFSSLDDGWRSSFFMFSVFVRIAEWSFFLFGGGFNGGAGEDDDGVAENFRRSTAIGGNSTPRKGLLAVDSGWFWSVFVVIVQRSCIFFSRRDMRSVINGLLLDDRSFVIWEVCDKTTDSSAWFFPFVELEQMSSALLDSCVSIMTLVLFEARGWSWWCWSIVDEPSTQIETGINRMSALLPDHLRTCLCSFRNNLNMIKAHVSLSPPLLFFSFLSFYTSSSLLLHLQLE